MNRQVKLIVVIALTLVLAVIGSLALLPSSGTTISQQVTLPVSFASAATYNANNLVLSNGRAFVRYNYSDGSSQLLSPDDPASGLADIDSLTVSSDHNYFLFHQEQAPEASKLQAILKQRNLDATLDYWWLYNQNDKSFQPLPAGVLLAKFNNSEVDALASGSSGESITNYSLTNLSQTGRIDIVGSTDFWPYSNGFLLQLGNGNIAFTTDGVVSQTYYTNITMVGLVSSGQGNTAVATTGKGSDRQLLLLNLQKQSQKLIASSLTQAPVATDSGMVLYATAAARNNVSDQYHYYNAVTHKTTAWTLSGGAASLNQSQSAPLVAVLSPTQALGTTTGGGYFLFGNNLATIKTPTGFFENVTVGGVGLTVNYDTSIAGFTVSHNDLPLAAVQSAIYAKLRHEGDDPNLYPIIFSGVQTD